MPYAVGRTAGKHGSGRADPAFGAARTIAMLLAVLIQLAVANEDQRRRRRPRAEPG
jgi:hypothetical protein